MLKILSPLEMIQRVDVTAKTGGSVFASGTTGSWVQVESDGSGNPVVNLAGIAAAGGQGKPGWAVWTEGVRSVTSAYTYGAGQGQLAPTSVGGAGFSPDAIRTGKVTTLVGKWRGLTDQVETTNAPAIGDFLMISTATPGKLTKITTYAYSGLNSAGNYPVAIIRGGPYTSYSYLGNTYTGVYEIEALV